jgi:hypothetical protein
MNIRQRKRTIYLASGLIAAIGLAVAAWALATPVEIARPADASGDAPGPAPGRTGAAGPSYRQPGEGDGISRDELARLCARDLRRPLFAPEPTVEQAEKPEPRPQPRRPMSAQLVGTIVEPGRSMAVFRMSDGSFELCGTGESIEDPGGEVKVRNIEPYEVTVNYASQTRTLTIERTPKSLVFGAGE